MNNERYLTQHDAATLSELAEKLLRVRDTGYNAAEALLELLSSATLLPEDTERNDIVSLYADITYRRIGSEGLQNIMLVCPHDANSDLARVSVLAPLALALLGRVKGSIVDIHLPFNAVQYIEIVDVGAGAPPLHAGAQDESAALARHAS